MTDLVEKEIQSDETNISNQKNASKLISDPFIALQK
jgi:hypothetical protein